MLLPWKKFKATFPKLKKKSKQMEFFKKQKRKLLNYLREISLSENNVYYLQIRNFVIGFYLIFLADFNNYKEISHS